MEPLLIEYSHGMYPSSSLRGRVKNFRKVFTGGGGGSEIFILVWGWGGYIAVGGVISFLAGREECSRNFEGKFQIE